MSIVDQIKAANERRQRAIPSRVYFNRFHAIAYHILADDDRYKLRPIQRFSQLSCTNPEFNQEECRKLLWNCWSTEYAFRLSGLVDDPEFYRYALHWNFPQAYYSLYLSMTAYQFTQGTESWEHEKSIKVFGNHVKDGHYPEAVSFYASGQYENTRVYKLPLATRRLSEFEVLASIQTTDDAQMAIKSFLKSKREKNAEHKRERLKQKNDRRFHTGSGTFTKRFTENHWNLIYQTIPVTSLMNIMYRLRIKANYRDIQTFMDAEGLDYKMFHESLSSIVDYMNFVHEAYVCKAIGQDAYETILNGFRGVEEQPLSKNRYESHIRPLFS